MYILQFSTREFGTDNEIVRQFKCDTDEDLERELIKYFRIDRNICYVSKMSVAWHD